jgi:hypothetical protein
LMLILYSLIIDVFMLGRNLPVLKRAWPKWSKKNTVNSHHPKLQ